MEISDTLREILRTRGIEEEQEIEEFLNPKYENSYDPFLLADMDRAVERIERAITDSESIVIYGDYDIDGLSATALLLDALDSMGANVDAYIPDRFEEGYGINKEALRKIKADGADLVITVDCGSSSHEPLQWAHENSLSVVVTDHHTVKDTLPEAEAIVNPKRKDNEYPFSDLAGVGVAFKLVQAVQIGINRKDDEVPKLPFGQEKWLLDLVALGTVCDVVGLVDENRIFVHFGLKVFSRTPRVGMQALMTVAGVDASNIDTHHFGFVIGPRLNAAGRIEHAKLALELFTTKDKRRALELAKRLEELNAQRRAEQDRIMEMALEQALERSQDKVLVLSDPSWSHGIVGIVAAKIMERFSKPTIILQELSGEAKGSARSLGGFSIVEAMKAADDMLITYGGHHVAAGCKLKIDNMDRFRTVLNDYFDQGEYGDLKPQPSADITLDSLEVINDDFFAEMKRLAPFGMGNPRPLLSWKGVDSDNYRLVGSDGRHVKLTLRDGSYVLDGIGFNLAEDIEEVDGVATVWFELDENIYMGRRSLQALIKAVA